MPILPQSLVCLDLTNHQSEETFCFEDLQVLEYGENRDTFSEDDLEHPELSSWPNLEEIYTNNSDSMDEDMFEFFTRASIAAGKLRIMDVGWRSDRPAAYPDSDSLVGLGLAHTRGWNDNIILEMVLKYPNLRELDLSKTKVTGYALKKMLKKGLPLTKVVLKDCEDVSSDAFDYLESKGVTVVQW